SDDSAGGHRHAWCVARCAAASRGATGCSGSYRPAPLSAARPVNEASLNGVDSASSVAELVFFYGTLMTPFNRTGRLRIERHLSFKGRGTIGAALFDIGIYPAAVPAAHSRV